MKRRRLWMVVFIVLTLAWFGGATAILIGQKDEASQRMAYKQMGSCRSGLGMGRSPEEVEEARKCLEPYRAHEDRMLMRVIESALIAGACAAAFWALFALVFFGRRPSRDGRDEPEAVA
jgi:hypothetical protein